jgi:hypothetical protein
MNIFQAQLLIRDKPLLEIAKEQGWQNGEVETRRVVSVEEFEGRDGNDKR